MNIPSQEKGPQSFVDEQQRPREYSEYEELHTSREGYKSPELFRSSELQEPKRQTPSARKKQDHEKTVRLLSQYVASITAVTVVAGTTILAPPSESPPPPLPTFVIEREAIGLHDYQAIVTKENADDLTLQVVLTTADGEILDEAPLPADGVLIYADLANETSYTVRLQDETQTELFTHTFTTDPFVTLTEESNDTLLLTIHEEIPLGTDVSFELLDGEGKSFRDNVYSVMLDDGRGDVENWDSTDSSQFNPTFAYYLFKEGLYTGEYTLQFISYPPDIENELVYETKVTLGDLSPLRYTPTVDGAGGTVTLTYLEGDLGPYTELSADLYQGESYGGYVDTADMTFDDDGSISFPISSDWTTGTYTLYLIGNYQQDGIYLYNQIYKCEITI